MNAFRAIVFASLVTAGPLTAQGSGADAYGGGAFAQYQRVRK